MKARLFLLLSLLVVLSVCNFGQTLSSPEPTEPPPPSGAPKDERCGDGVCEGPENSANCPADCVPEQSSPQPDSPTKTPDRPSLGEGIIRELWVTNPTSGNRMYVQRVNAEGWDGTPLPTLVLVPDGFGEGSSFTGERRTAQKSPTVVLPSSSLIPRVAGTATGQRTRMDTSTRTVWRRSFKRWPICRASTLRESAWFHIRTGSPCPRVLWPVTQIYLCAF